MPDDESGELRVEIFLEDHQTGEQVLWVFPCDSGSKPDNLLSHTCTETDNTYDEDNLLVQNVYPDQACEARFILDEKDQVTISGAPDARLELELLENEYGDGGFDSEMEYAQGLFDADRMKAFHELYVDILERIVKQEDVWTNITKVKES